MKVFKNQAAQGDLLIRRISSIPVSAAQLQPEGGVYVVAHSETGHHHVIDATQNVKVYSTPDPLVSYLQVIEATEATETLLRHLRGHDTHETLRIPAGVYELRRQREYVPGGQRRAAD